MKWIVWTLCLLCPLSALPDENLSKQECIELADKGKGDLALNSLRMSFVEQSESEEWNEDEFAMTFMLLYNVYSEHGMLREKSDLCSYAMRTFNRKSPERNTEFSRMLWRMGGRVRVDLKDYDSTIFYLRQAQWMYEDKSIYDSGYFTILADIGWCCLYKKDYANARLYLDEAEDIHSKYFGDIKESGHPESCQLMNLKGILSQSLGDESEAERCFLSVLHSDSEDSSLEWVKDVARNSLGILYFSKGRYGEAMALFDSVKSSTAEAKYSKAQNTAFCALMNKDYDVAVEYLRLSNEAGLDYSQSVVTDFAEAEREDYWQGIAYQMMNNNNLFPMIANREKSLRMGFEMNSFLKDFNLDFQQLIKSLYLNGGTSEQRKTWEQYQTKRGLLSYGFDTAERHDSIAIEVMKSEREILSEVNFNIHDFFRNNYDIEKLQQKLSPDEAIIDFIYMPALDGNSITADFGGKYYAYSLSSESATPHLTTVCKQLDLASSVYRPTEDAEFINKIYTEKNDTLYKLVIEPLLPVITGKNRLYIRSAGLLSSVNIEAIVMPDGRRFGDEYEILLVSNFNNIKPDKSVRYSDIALFGDPDFFSDRNNNIKAGIIEMRPSVEYETLRSVRGNWTSLPGTRNEVDKISEIASENNISSKAFIGDNASETMVKSLSGKSPSIMHFATHGYFITSNEEIRHSSFLWQTMGYSRNSHLMLYSGLLFAGADEVWNGKARPNPKDDGILTSDEISRLDFSNTDLVVLSACNTGNGHQNDVDGIMGLRRAFRAAGAGTMVVSLWKVPDDATSRLMQYFYRYLFANHSARESLKYAQQELRNDGYADPYYWASFVVID